MAYLLSLIVLLTPAQTTPPEKKATAQTAPPAKKSKEQEAPPKKKKPADEEIRTVYRAYRSALIKNNGEAAWKLVDAQTKQYYSDVIRAALSFDRAEFEALNPVSKLIVVRLRVEFSKDRLSKLTGREVFTYAVTKHWVTKTSQGTAALSKITIKDKLAEATVPTSGEVPAFFFVKEGEDWKLALSQSFDLAGAALREAAKQSQMAEDLFILELTRQSTRIFVPDAVLDGPIDKKVAKKAAKK